MRTTESFASDTLSLIRRASVNCSARSASVTSRTAVLREISIPCVRVSSPAFSRTEYWPWLVVAAFFVFVLETVLANYFTRRRRGEAPPTTEYLGTRRGEELLAQRVGAA